MPSVYRSAQSAATATNLTQLNVTTSYTVAFWARPQRDFFNVVGGDIVRHASTANPARDGYAFYFSGNHSVLNARHFTGAAQTTYTPISGDPSEGIWKHYALVFDGSAIYGFINGSLKQRTAATVLPTANASCTTTTTPAIVGTMLGNLFDFQMLPNVVVPLDNVKLLMNPRYTHPDIKARWFGLEFTGVGPSATLRDESGNGSNLTTSTGRFLSDAEPPYLPTLG